MTPLKPGRGEFDDLVASGCRVIPVWTEIVSDGETPISAYAKLGTSEPSFLFESAEQNDHVGRFSFLGVGTRLTITARGHEVTIGENGLTQTHTSTTDPFRDLEDIMARFPAHRNPALPAFVGGAVGYLAYDAVRWFEPTVPAPPPDPLGVPDMFFMLADRVLVFDHKRRRLILVVNAFLDDGNPAEVYARAASEIDQMLEALARPLAFPPVFASPPTDMPEPQVVSNTAREEYFDMILRAQEYIRAGDIFQIVPAQRFEVPFSGHPLELYRMLRFINPSPYMFCLRCPGGFSLVGSSPEVHVRLTDRLVEIRPIAGTRRRGVTPEEDAANAADLLADPKERAEHLMLVDLARNDVGRIADFGSVRVSEFMTVERYSHVMHIVSHVSGHLAGDRNAYDVMRATFPAGTVSGSPKVRAMQIINKLEKNKRCTYAGAVGYFGFDGNLDSCIALRTILLKDGKAFIQAGGGVVADSSPEGEYQESVNKAMAAVRAVARAGMHTSSSPFIIPQT
ncbi:MAG: anthranilate synthase component I [Terrimicrobiaceae bacterium]